MKTAIVHEWLVNYAGSERVLEQIIELYPDADLFSLFDFLPEGKRHFILNKHVNTSFIQKLPLAKTKYRYYLPLMPYAVEQFDFSRYDLIMSNSHAVAKGIRKNANQLHICYCHTPMRYIWDLQDQYLKETRLDRGIRGAIIKTVFKRIRRWDVSTAKTVDYFIANSHYIKDRIKRIYQKDATVIYPPVDVENFQISDKKEDFFLTVARMVPYKKVDLIVDVFSEIGLPLIVIGDGPDFQKVKRKAKKNVEFTGYLKADVLKTYMQKARAFVFAAQEDFGIAPVEAQACGLPVIAFGQGGVSETVVPFLNTEHPEKFPKSFATGQVRYWTSRIQNSDHARPSGIFFYEQTHAALLEAIKRFESIEDKFNPYEIRENTEKFNIERFKREFKDFVNGKIKEFYG